MVNNYPGVTSIVIPSTVTNNGRTYIVTTIGVSAFSGCRELKSASLPITIKSIRWNAFRNCSGLTSIIIPRSVTKIEGSTFSGCSGLTSFTIVGPVERIDDFAFKDCVGLTHIRIPSSVTSLSGAAFAGCSGIESIIVDGNSKYASPYDCNAVIDMNAGTLVLGCKNTTIPSTVTSIGDYAFYGCRGLKSFTLPRRVTKLGRLVFAYCSGLESLSVEEGNTKYFSPNNCNAILSSGFLAFVGESWFLEYGCKNTVIPDSVTMIHDWAFTGCSGLTSIDLPSSIRGIGEDAFMGTGLESIVIPELVTALGPGAVSHCSALKSVFIGKSVETLDYEVFAYCDSIETMVVDAENTNFDSRDNCNAIIHTSNNQLKFGCTTTIIPNTVKRIGEDAFKGCRGLTSVVIPESVTTIGYNAFFECTGLESVTLPSTISSLQIEAFSGCSGLREIKSRITTGLNETWMMGEDVFAGVPKSTCLLKVPTGMVYDYRHADQWKEFVHIVEERLSAVGDLNNDYDVDGLDLNLLINMVLGKESAPDFGNASPKISFG